MTTVYLIERDRRADAGPITPADLQALATRRPQLGQLVVVEDRDFVYRTRLTLRNKLTHVTLRLQAGTLRYNGRADAAVRGWMLGVARELEARVVDGSGKPLGQGPAAPAWWSRPPVIAGSIGLVIAVVVVLLLALR